MESSANINSPANPNLQQAYAKKAQLAKKLQSLKEASTNEPREGQNSAIVDEVTGLLKDVELEIKE